MGTMGSISISIFLGALIVVAVLALMVLLCVWTYRDAQHKGMNGILWTLVVLLVPSFVGLIIYLVVRIDAKKVTCSKCMKSVNGNSKYCSNCGEELIPVLEVSEEDEVFRKSQKKVLIGFFSTLGGLVVAVIFMVAFLINGVISAIGDGAELISNLSSNNTIEMLNDLDTLIGESGLKVHVDDDKVIIKDENGDQLIYVDENGDSVDVDVSAIKKLMDKYSIEYDESITDEELEEAVEELVKELEDTQSEQ